MDGHPVLIFPEDTDFVALGSAGAIFQHCERREHVLKAPLKYDVTSCSPEVVECGRNREDFSDLYISREKLIYGVIPKDSNILECLSINERGLEFPYYRLGSLRDFMQRNQQHISDKTRDQWVMSAVDSIVLIHKYGVIHPDISPWNFLVAQDLSIQLCDFSGSAIGDLEALVQEEDRYRLFPWAPRSVQTDLFALGCLIFEISTGVRPYDDIDDQNYEEIERRYTARTFPSLDGNPYRDAILKCWTLQYTSVDDLRSELRQFSK